MGPKWKLAAICFEEIKQEITAKVFSETGPAEGKKRAVYVHMWLRSLSNPSHGTAVLQITLAHFRHLNTDEISARL